jgi:hypothetical protein
MRPYLKKPFTKIGLVEWLKMKALSSIKSQYWGGKKKIHLGWQSAQVVGCLLEE